MGLLDRLRSRARKGENGRVRKIFELLETRIVLDAAMHADLDKDHQDAQAQATLDTHTGDVAADIWGAQGQGQLSDADLKVVVVSDSLGDIGDIYDAVSDDVKVIVLDSQHDNLATLTEKIGDLVKSTGHEVGDLAILDHGAEGVLQIGGEFITLADLGSHQGEFHTLGTYLSDDAQIQLYGCDVAAGDQGYLLISGIADATGASLWASDDATGSLHGADWTLEVHAGDSQYDAFLFDAHRLSDSDYYLSVQNTANNGSTSVNEDGSVTLTVQGDARPGIPLGQVHFNVVGNVTHGNLTAVGNPVEVAVDGTHSHYQQTFTYAPNASYNGGDSFTFQLATDAAQTWTVGVAYIAPRDFLGGSVALGDLDHDGDTDMVIGSSGAGGFAVVYNNGYGDFSSYTEILPPSGFVVDVKLGDINGDGWSDIAVGMQGFNARVYWNDGTGLFHSSGTGAYSDVPVPSFSGHTYTPSGQIALGDVNNDGKLDVAQVVTEQWNMVTPPYAAVYRTEGIVSLYSASLNFATPNSSAVFGGQMLAGSSSPGYASIDLADMNHDNILDAFLGATDPSQNSYVYLGHDDGMGKGDGTFVSFYAFSGQQQVHTAAADLDGNGLMDFVAAARDGTTRVYFGDGSGTAYTVGTFVHNYWATSVVLNDMDGDGDKDIVLGHNGGGDAFVYYNDGAGNFPRVDQINSAVSHANNEVAVGNMDGDLKLDIVTVNTLAPKEIIYEKPDARTSNTATYNVTVNAVNDAPVIVPSSNEFTNVHGTPTTFTVTVNDVDDPEGGTYFPMRVTLTVAHGVVSLDNLAGLTFITGDGIADSTMTFQGDRGDINSALRGATYTGDASYVGHDGLNIVANDLGNTGSGGPLQDSKTVSIEVGLPTNTIAVPQATPAYSTVTTPSALFTAAENGQFDWVAPRVPYFQGSIYFAIDPAGVGLTDWTIWRYDVAAGTATAITVPGSAGFDINSGGILDITEFNGNLIFGGYQSNIGFRVWAVETFSNTAFLAYSDAPDTGFSFISVALGPQGANYASGHPTSGSAYSLYGNELYAEDSSIPNGRLVADIWPGSSSSTPTNLTSVGNSLYFAANGGTLGLELWKYDATTNTLTQWDINPGSGSSNPTGLVYYDNIIRFVATDGSGNRGFWQLNTATNELSLWTNDPKALSDGAYSAIFGSPIINNVEYEVGTGSVKLYSFTGQSSSSSTDPTTLPRFYDDSTGTGATPGVGFEVGEAEKETKPILTAEAIKDKKPDQPGVTLGPPPPPPPPPTHEFEGEALGAGLGQGGLWANLESHGVAGPRNMGSQGLAGALDPNALLTNLVFNFDTQQAAQAFTGPNIPGEWMTFTAGNKPSLAFNADLRSVVQSVLGAGTDLATGYAIFGSGGSW